ncbi:DUF427 domain-containing protein [Actinophytocola algeriensis]|jgi:uncharacterized protein (DUF427 family)|uniref:Uncharacterized protein (DUF427 family) n=1 Tax=Actinophytocola algeriensis TaxID=1768010 RepID=A0A7W7Q105_9PSEU|nr:DUF427 domain-containing protein [Actinophytocola algeriensis]MBB4905015.1 uncharacterized protein (DUF427 family) [Actinophytocola algeriensis]MBE1476125.1 uncharacterized protein (DUF427 family) [Actinophytocola algeriensis]
MSREMKTPGPDHPITVEKNPARVTVRVGDQVVADTTAALVLQESNYPAVQYIPLADVDPAHIRATDTTTYCPFKGDASYYTLVTKDGEHTDAVWTYRTPYPAVAEIADHVAFYPNKVEITQS